MLESDDPGSDHTSSPYVSINTNTNINIKQIFIIMLMINHLTMFSLNMCLLPALFPQKYLDSFRCRFEPLWLLVSALRRNWVYILEPEATQGTAIWVQWQHWQNVITTYQPPENIYYNWVLIKSQENNKSYWDFTHCEPLINVCRLCN